eukprot:2981466-Pyramimonas_sp.AAC.1
MLPSPRQGLGLGGRTHYGRGNPMLPERCIICQRCNEAYHAVLWYLGFPTPWFVCLPCPSVVYRGDVRGTPVHPHQAVTTM